MKKEIQKIYLYQLLEFFFMFIFQRHYEKNIKTNLFYIAIATFIIGVLGWAARLLFVMILNIINYSRPTLYSLIEHNLSNTIFITIIIVVVVPFIEELSFRLPIIFNRTHILISIISYYIAIYITSQKGINRILNQDFSSIANMNFIIIIVVATALFIIISNKTIKIYLELFWNKNTYFLALILSFVFAYWHLEFPISLHNLPWIVSALVPYILHGLFFSYIRLKHGFFSAVFSHSTWNLIPGLSILFFS